MIEKKVQFKCPLGKDLSVEPCEDCEHYDRDEDTCMA